MKLRHKLYFVFSFFSILILSLGIFSIISLYNLSSDSESIIKSNLESTVFTFNLAQSLSQVNNIIVTTGKSESTNDFPNEMSRKIDSLSHIFSVNLDKEKNNITEPGESSLVDSLLYYSNLFFTTSESIKSDNKSVTETLPALQSHYNNAQRIINRINDLNINSIYLKNRNTQINANTTIIVAFVCLFLSFVLSGILLIYFPDYIIKPIDELTQKIKSISEKKYEQIITKSENDELGLLIDSFNIMAEKLQNYESAHLDLLLLEKLRLETILLTTNDGILILNPDRLLLIANSISGKILGLPKDDIFLKSLNDIVKDSLLIKKVTGGFELLNDNQRYNFNDEAFEFIINGESSYFTVEIIKLQTVKSGKTIKLGYVIFFKNITSYVLKDAAKTNLLATVSHELKTPISAINMSTSLLQDIRVGDLNQKQKKLIDSIVQQTTRLSAVVKEVLEYSQIESGNIRLNLSRTSVIDIIELATFALLLFISEKKIVIDLDIEDNLPSVKADIEKTVWVLVNILSNAIRFSHQEGKILISAKHIHQSVVLSVKDFGKGIDDSSQHKVFEKYAKLAKDDKKGSGLGLAIAKEFVEAQNGKIWFESKLNQGTTFYFSVPILS